MDRDDDIPLLQFSRYGVGVMTGRMKMQDQKMEDQMSGVENAGPKNAGPKHQDRKMEDQQPEADYEI